ncbi:MAG: glutamine synthetase III [Planctomycetaceae bacterium]|nr:glutamine synthetase III [Planctomycetaceae bacterium]
MIRFQVIAEAYKRKAVPVETPASLTSEYYGKNVFNRAQMSKYLSKETMQSLCDAIDEGEPLDRDIVDHVAAGMKRWALENGATHYTHWFQPLSGGTAEKHDSFIESDGNGGVIEEFAGKLLVQQEPDASSFPSGGIRNTFEARGYTAWDPSSPAFLVDDTLCIPSVFISYTGESLDYKTPLLKASNAIGKAATDVCRYFDENVAHVTPYLGWEQEYFLIDDGLYAARPDLVLSGRTLMGHKSAKSQQLEDHYFGSIPTRVTAFMKDLEYEGYKYGIPLKTRHNETAPNQFEVTPIFEEMNLANDHNQLLMSIMKKVARRHSFRVLLHEKPFVGINGSGKHCNWSLGTDTAVELFAPGKTLAENIRFITFLVNVLVAVYKHNALLKASIMTAQNAHRLGADEAPPAIVSVFLGSEISALLDKLEISDSFEEIFVEVKRAMKLGVALIPEVLVDNTDRNRTSPLAFTGNRFEFRAVGASANCAVAMISLNTAVARQLQLFKKEVDRKIKNETTQEEAIFEVVKSYIKESKPIRFNGNGYDDAWKKEAANRGLNVETCVPLIYDAYTTKETFEMFRETGVLTEKELIARTEFNLEYYSKKIEIEASILSDLAANHIIPVATRYQSSLLENVARIQQVFPAEKFGSLATGNLETIEEIGKHIGQIKLKIAELTEMKQKAKSHEHEREKAIVFAKSVVPLLEEARTHIDALELIVDDELWPLPKYRELLFTR